MTLDKTIIQNLIDKSPDQIDPDQLVNEILLLKKIETARAQMERGEFLTEEELDKEIDSWK
jgi:hypothetical protein